jgi:hypothetical protein
MAEGVPGYGDGSFEAGPAPPGRGTPTTPGPISPDRKRWRRGRWVGLILAVVLLISLPSLYYLGQQESRVTRFTISGTSSSCPTGVSLPPAPGEATGACEGLHWLSLPVLSSLPGVYTASNSSPVRVVISFLSQGYSPTASAGSFSRAGKAPFTWSSAPAPFGPGDCPVEVPFLVVSNYPITVTIEGSYSSPLFA